MRELDRLAKGKPMEKILRQEKHTTQFLIKTYDGEGKLGKRMEVRPPPLGHEGPGQADYLRWWSAG